MAVPQPIKRFTPQEYYAAERGAAYRSDYFDGEIFAMAGTSTNHSLITVNISAELHQRLKGTPCAALDSNQRLKVKATGLRSYPDVSVYCGPLEYDPDDSQKETATNPTVLVEILSDSTEGYERGFKSENFRQIESLRAYLLVSQHRPHVELYERQDDGSWRLSEVSGLESSVDVSAIRVRLELSGIYDRVTFPSPGMRVSPGT
jgi:Uma2 family endonuclease